jgi:flagellar biogenesis protein FliO
MLTQLALLPLAAITVTGVTSEHHDSDVIIDVATSEPVPAHVARPMAGHRLLYVFVDDATPTDAVFENGEHPVVARTRPRYTKLEVPLDPGVRCREPALVETLPSGLRVQFSCDTSPGAVVTAAEGRRRPVADGRRPNKPASPSASQELLQAALALPAEMPFAAGTETEEDENQATKPAAADKPKQAVQAPAPPEQEAKAAAPTAAAAPVPAETAAPLGQAAQAAETPPAKPAPAAAPKAAASAVAPAHDVSAPVVAVAASSRSGSSLVLAIVLLVAVAGGALALTRRRARRQGLIQILETAAIGPKRSLLVARVNGRTMVLGASEAGIALLASLDGGIAPPIAAVMGTPPHVEEQPDEPASTSAAEAAVEPEGEMGMLRRLFHRQPKDSSTQDAAAFRELLEESYEDQELRGKLAQGLSGKVS